MDMNRHNKRQASSSNLSSDNESWKQQGKIKINFANSDKSKIIIYNTNVSTQSNCTSVTNTGSRNGRRKSKLITLQDNDNVTFYSTDKGSSHNQSVNESANNSAVCDNTAASVDNNYGAFVIEETGQAMTQSYNATAFADSLPEQEVIPLDSMNEEVSNEVEIAYEPNAADDHSFVDFPHHFLAGFSNSPETEKDSSSTPAEPVANTSSSDLCNLPVAEYQSNNQDMNKITNANQNGEIPLTIGSNLMQWIPNTFQVFVCPPCNLQFANCIMFNKHCEEVHRNLPTVANHIKKQGLFVCPACPKSFIQQSYLQQHWRLLHASKINYEFLNEKRCGMYYCPHCLKAFEFRNYLQQHIKVVHQQVEYKCSSCNRSFISMTNYERHTRVCRKLQDLEVREEEEEKSYTTKDESRWKCRLCHKSLKSIVTLEQHIQVVHASYSRILKCSKTGKS